jgi:hypothetical protein
VVPDIFGDRFNKVDFYKVDEGFNSLMLWKTLWKNSVEPVENPMRIALQSTKPRNTHSWQLFFVKFE